MAGGRTPHRPGRRRVGPEGRGAGSGEILLTSMDADGTKAGFDLEMTRAVTQAVSIPVIASGGCGSLEHFAQVFAETDCDAALAASPVPLRGADSAPGEGVSAEAEDPGALRGADAMLDDLLELVLDVGGELLFSPKEGGAGQARGPAVCPGRRPEAAEVRFSAWKGPVGVPGKKNHPGRNEDRYV